MNADVPGEGHLPMSRRAALVPTGLVLVGLLLSTVPGCGGEPEPLQIKDPAKAREVFLRKTEGPARRPAPKRH